MEGLRERVGLTIDEAESALARVSSAVRRQLAIEGLEHFISQRAQLALMARIEILEDSLAEAREKLRREDLLGALARAHLVRTASEELDQWILRESTKTPDKTKTAAVANGEGAATDRPVWKQSV